MSIEQFTPNPDYGLASFRKHFGRDPEDAAELEFWNSMPEELRPYLATEPPTLTPEDYAIAQTPLGSPEAVR